LHWVSVPRPRYPQFQRSDTVPQRIELTAAPLQHPVHLRHLVATHYELELHHRHIVTGDVLGRQPRGGTARSERCQLLPPAEHRDGEQEHHSRHEHHDEQVDKHGGHVRDPDTLNAGRIFRSSPAVPTRELRSPPATTRLRPVRTGSTRSTTNRPAPTGR